MKINNVEVIGNRFAYDGCHKIYVIENQEDEQKSRECGYEILDISQLIKMKWTRMTGIKEYKQ